MDGNIMFTENLDELGALLEDENITDDDLVCAAAQLEEYETLSETDKSLEGAVELSARARKMVEERGLEGDVESFKAMAIAAEESDLTQGGVNLKRLAEYNNVKQSLINKYAALTPFQRETTIRFKSDLESPTLDVEAGERWDESGFDENGVSVMNEGTEYEVRISKNEDGTYHCASEYLGTFDYPPEAFAVGYKEVEGEDTLKLPVLRCLPDAPASGAWYDSEQSVGLETYDTGWMAKNRRRPEGSGYNMSFQEVRIPEGVKNIDYTFEDLDNLNFIPRLPDSLESAHCAFKGCDHLWQESATALDSTMVDFGDHRKMHWPPCLMDMSSMLAGCSELHDLKFCDLPKEALTIDNMFGDCPELFEGVEVGGLLGLLPWAGKTDGILQGTFLSTANEISWSDSPYLLREFANCTTANTSEVFKAVKEREEAERRETQAEFDEKEAAGEVSEEEAAKHDDAKAANAVRSAEKVLKGDDFVGTPEDMSLILPENKFGEFVQKGIVDVGAYLGISTVTGLVTDSKLLKFVAGVGGTFLLRQTNILPTTIEPALNWIKDQLPEGTGKTVLGGIIDKIHVPTQEEIQAAYDDRQQRFTTEALNSVYTKATENAASMDLREAMEIQGGNMMKQGVYETAFSCGPEGQDIQDLRSVTHAGILSLEEMFDRNAEKYDEETLKAQMKDSYIHLMDGYAAADKGARDAMPDVCGSEEDARNALSGLGMVNQVSVEETMESLLKYDEQYYFMEESDWEYLSSLELTGVGDLREYAEGTWKDDQIQIPEEVTEALEAQGQTEVPTESRPETLPEQGTYTETGADRDLEAHHQDIVDSVNNLAVNQPQETGTEMGAEYMPG